MNINDDAIKALMEKYKLFTVYGLSSNTSKASHTVPLYMRDHGWQVVGVHPKPHNENDFKIYQSLKDVPEDYRKFVDVFRRPEEIPDLVDEIISVGGVEVLWLQLGIQNAKAEVRAQNAGIKVVSNRCLVIEHKKWFKS